MMASTRHIGIVNRQLSYTRRLRVSTSDLELARQGIKTCTIRLGTATSVSRCLELSDDSASLPIEVTHVDTSRKYAELTERDARDEGMSSLTELDADLRRYYGAIDPAQPMTVLHFRLRPQLG